MVIISSEVKTVVRYLQTPCPKYGQTPKDYYDTHLNVGQDGLEVTELDWSGRLASSTRCRSWYWHSWGRASPDFCLGCNSSRRPFIFSLVMIVLPNKFLTQNNYCREFMEDKITLLTPQFLCETYFQRRQPWGHIIIV